MRTKATTTVRTVKDARRMLKCILEVGVEGMRIADTIDTHPEIEPTTTTTEAAPVKYMMWVGHRMSMVLETTAIAVDTKVYPVQCQQRMRMPAPVDDTQVANTSGMVV
uniref:Hydroxylamine reductase n=1 Tax=Lygus hesperus TaxID=30085 RepID=A0A0A9Y208_LYGHE